MDELLLSFDKKQKCFVNVHTDNTQEQYCSINLNQNYKCSNETFFRSQSKIFSKIDKKIASSFSATDNNSERNFGSWTNSTLKNNQFSTNFSLSNCDDKIDKKVEKQWQNANITSSNSSTLSLHIAKYEDSVENNTVSIVDEIEGKKLGSIKKWKNAKVYDSSMVAVQNPFEFPRQQKSDATKPEIMQFKASQKLLHLNDPNSSINHEQDSSCKTAKLPDFIQKSRKRKSSEKKKDEFITKIKNRPISIQKSMISAEIAKLEKKCSHLTATTNAQHFITKKKLEKRVEFLMNYVSRLHSPSAKTAQLPKNDYFDAATPKTAISPIMDRMEERIDQIRIQLKAKQIKMEDLELIKEKLEIEQKMLKRYEKEVNEMGKEIKEFEERILKNSKVKDQLIKMIAECEAEHLHIKNDFKLCHPKITEMGKKVKKMKKLIHRCNAVTTKLNSGESRLSWELWILSPFYNFILWILFVWSLFRDETAKFFAVFVNNFEQKKLKK